MRHFSLALLLGGSLVLASCSAVQPLAPANAPGFFQTQSSYCPPCKVTGGGFIEYVIEVDPKVTFGFVAQPNDPFKGSIEVNDHGTGQKFHSNEVANLVCNGNTATFTGILGDNSDFPGRRYVVVTTDNGEPGNTNSGKGSDTWCFTVYDNGTVLYTRGGTLAGGNIQIHAVNGNGPET